LAIFRAPPDRRRFASPVAFEELARFPAWGLQPDRRILPAKGVLLSGRSGLPGYKAPAYADRFDFDLAREFDYPSTWHVQHPRRHQFGLIILRR
jgi:hypothetical protein